ncbi:Uncharacterised protein [Vibrio cholerae]|nr:Uncharacterised protein [Vibrio cholerae]
MAPRRVGRSGVKARARKSTNAGMGSSADNASSESGSIWVMACEVRNPSKKCTNGKRHCKALKVAMAARSCASCALLAQSIATPVWRMAITSE